MGLEGLAHEEPEAFRHGSGDGLVLTRIIALQLM
jgi:hypothetical protein